MLAVSSQNQTGEEEEFHFSARSIWNRQRASHLLVNYEFIINSKASISQSIKLNCWKCRLKERLLFILCLYSTFNSTEQGLVCVLSVFHN